MSLTRTLTADAAELIRKLGEATEGNWELDFEIQQQVEGWRNLGGGWREILATGKHEQWNYTRSSPAYSTSLDAALTLVPESAIWKVFSDWPGCFYWAVVECDNPMGPDDFEYRSDAEESPALALCIACLKARSAK